ncbi:Protein CBG18269 [Caenorhabditis briggsae]|uniref:Major sperm protein n=2 Tax=Caenorhabditis briggsae TaxID=6238 RepID=A0AAE9EJV1_CAEBR|nr:Protein CBG18269 [Caenorhabditis briggsae]ULU00095.1 hypothetical protein L3Y34_000966 [Caenorhabditis briggsae]UMM22782.1 hypothetical protein L5515_003821 [Caenorhabditis briggsae]CAP35749.1 Protein CBG18269 [Caenorhabditis briggsae]
MLYELILLGVTSIFLLAGCSKKKAAPSVAKSPVNPPKEVAASTTKSPVSKSPAKDTEGDEKKDTEGDEKGTKGDKKDDDKKDDDEKKDDKKKSDEKDDEKKEDDGEKKKDDDEKDDDKKEDDKGKKKEALIRVDPTELTFETATTSQKKLRLKNLTSKRLMFKMKASTTNAYLINPVFGKIEPNNFADVMITHRPSAKREDKLVILTTEMLGKEIEMAKTFKQIKTTGADVNVKLVAA